VPEVILDAVDNSLLVVPVEAMHPEIVAMELRVSGRLIVFCRVAEHHER
jgi:hypothetical protein